MGRKSGFLKRISMAAALATLAPTAAWAGSDPAVDVARIRTEMMAEPGNVVPEIREMMNDEDVGLRVGLQMAADEMSTDAETATAKDRKESLVVTVNRVNLESGASYLLTHVVIKDPSQIKSGLANDSYGSGFERPTSASKRLGWVVGVNGGNFDWGTARPTYAAVKIKGGQIMHDSEPVADGREICLKKDGTLFSPLGGETAEELLAEGVTDTWTCGDCLLIRDGEAVNTQFQSEQYRYPRTAIGMVRPCEYYVITAGTGGYEGGMTYDEVRDALMEKGCVFGKCMDGGGSSSLVFEDELLNDPACGDERGVVDFLYFTELD